MMRVSCPLAVHRVGIRGRRIRPSYRRVAGEIGAADDFGGGEEPISVRRPVIGLVVGQQASPAEVGAQLNGYPYRSRRSSPRCRSDQPEGPRLSFQTWGAPMNGTPFEVGYSSVSGWMFLTPGRWRSASGPGAVDPLPRSRSSRAGRDRSRSRRVARVPAVRQAVLAVGRSRSAAPGARVARRSPARARWSGRPAHWRRPAGARSRSARQCGSARCSGHNQIVSSACASAWAGHLGSTMAASARQSVRGSLPPKWGH